MTDGILEFVEEILEVSFGFDIDAIWYNLEGRCNSLSYREKIEAFCYILKVAMDKGILKVANEGVFLEGTSQEISDIFKSSFPASEDKMSDDIFASILMTIFGLQEVVFGYVMMVMKFGRDDIYSSTQKYFVI